LSLLCCCSAPLGAPSAAQAEIFNNMYPTATIPANCQDGVMGDLFCRTDNAALTYFIQSTIGTTGTINIDDVLYDQFNPTDLNVTYDGTPSYSGSAETDLIYQSGTVPTGLIGITWCNSAANYLHCDQQYIRTSAGNPSHNLICHESGHGVGLTHGDDADPYQDPTSAVLGCMRNPSNYITSPTLGSHNISEINAIY
jgi:hypothetical protein